MFLVIKFALLVYCMLLRPEVLAIRVVKVLVALDGGDLVDGFVFLCLNVNLHLVLNNLAELFLEELIVL